MRLADARFSPYRPNSELSRFNRGELASADLSTEFREVQQACIIWNQQTDGLFSANYGSQYDPSGLVKGWAVARGAGAGGIRMAPLFNKCRWRYFAAGRHDDTWSIGLQHPLIKQKLMGSLSVQTGAIATSGTYARGQHGEPTDWSGSNRAGKRYGRGCRNHTS
ncbi:FAD:protein FMN transferase [bacterium]|nr:MAG: FAD:protein FMN transferase [bacterium]